MPNIPTDVPAEVHSEIWNQLQFTHPDLWQQVVEAEIEKQQAKALEDFQKRTGLPF